MSFPRYPTYKDSGVEWLGDVPEHWEVNQGRRLFTQEREPARPTDDQLSATQKYGVVPQKLFMEMEDQKVALALNGLNSFKHVEAGDFVISLRSFQGGIERSAYPGCVSPAYTVLRPVKPIEGRFWSYLLKSKGYIEALQSMTDGIRDGKNISYQQFGQIIVPAISLPEQTQIAAFLDRETAKIDELVAEQRRLMELLKEKRQAVISHAVTQGLNPNAPMKPSGIEWLGDVPAHWRFGAIKYFVLAKNGSIKTGPFGSHLTSSEMQSGSIKVYNQRSVIDGDFDSGDNFISEDKFAELASFETFPGDLLITTRGTIGRAAILPENAERGILHPCLLRLQPDNSQIDTKFLKTLIQDSDLMKTQLSYLSNATTIEVIYSYTIASVIIPVPPLAEQDAIMQFLADETAKFDTLTAEAQRAIDLLQERRTALISAAVTGQIDVRDFVVSSSVSSKASCV